MQAWDLTKLQMLRFGTRTSAFIQFMTYLLVNFWVTSTLICSPGSFITQALLILLVIYLLLACLLELKPHELDIVSSSREGKYGHTCVVSLQNGSFVNGARKVNLIWYYLPHRILSFLWCGTQGLWYMWNILLQHLNLLVKFVETRTNADNKHGRSTFILSFL